MLFDHFAVRQKEGAQGQRHQEGHYQKEGKLEIKTELRLDLHLWNMGDFFAYSLYISEGRCNVYLHGEIQLRVDSVAN